MESQSGAATTRRGGVMRMDTQRASYKHPPRLPGKNTGTRSRTLTPRESDCVYWIGYGYSNKSLGILLDLSPKAVKRRLYEIFNKTGMSSRIELMKWAWDKGYCAL